MLRRDVTMTVSIGDRLARQAATELVGRAKELAILAQLLDTSGYSFSYTWWEPSAWT